MVDMFDLVRMEKGGAPLGNSEAAQEYRDNNDPSAAAAKAGASQTSSSGAAAQPASARVAPGVTVKSYGGKGSGNIRNTTRGNDYSDINMRRKRKTASGAVGL
jgi:hypothetical protein